MSKPIAGFSNYEVSEDGQVLNLSTGKCAAAEITRLGYVRVKIKGDDGAWHKKLIHRLVAETFLGYSDLEVNHKDGSKANNTLPNLEYVSRSANLRHARTSGLLTTNKLLESEAQLVRDLKGSLSQRDIASLLGVSPACVGFIQRGLTYV